MSAVFPQFGAVRPDPCHLPGSDGVEGHVHRALGHDDVNAERQVSGEGQGVLARVGGGLVQAVDREHDGLAGIDPVALAGRGVE